MLDLCDPYTVVKNRLRQSLPLLVLTNAPGRVTLYALFGEVGMSDGGKQTINANAVYSRQEAAEILGVSLSTLKKLIDAGYLRVSRPDGIRRVFIQGSSILEMLDETAVERRV